MFTGRAARLTSWPAAELASGLDLRALTGAGQTARRESHHTRKRRSRRSRARSLIAPRPRKGKARAWPRIFVRDAFATAPSVILGRVTIQRPLVIADGSGSMQHKNKDHTEMRDTSRLLRRPQDPDICARQVTLSRWRLNHALRLP